MESSSKDMSFLSQLEVLSWHLIWSAFAILFCSVLAFIFKDFVFDTILLSPKDSEFITYRLFK